jgi:hypothetical protein
VKRLSKKIVSPVTLREVYQLPGDFSAKMIIDPAVSPQIERVEVDVRNSDGRTMEFTARRWGTKLTVSFKIDESTPDGVSVIDILLTRKDGPSIKERLDFWVVGT